MMCGQNMVFFRVEQLEYYIGFLKKYVADGQRYTLSEHEAASVDDYFNSILEEMEE